jgi:predicted metal-dependent phosphoesterase TrpH
MIEIDVDLHMHTRASFDGLMSVPTILAQARRRGLSAVAVTDHGTIAGGVAAFEANRSPDLVVIVGIEVASDVGDIVGLFVQHEIKSTAALDVVAEIHEQGGFVYLPHPYRHHQQIDQELLGTLDGVEIYNGRDHRPAADRALRDFVAPYGLAAMGGSDAHLPWEIGRARTRMRVPSHDADADAVRAALEARACYGVLAAGRSRSAVLLSKTTKRLRRLAARVELPR